VHPEPHATGTVPPVSTSVLSDRLDLHALIGGLLTQLAATTRFEWWFVTAPTDAGIAVLARHTGIEAITNGQLLRIEYDLDQLIDPLTDLRVIEDLAHTRSDTSDRDDPRLARIGRHNGIAAAVTEQVRLNDGRVVAYLTGYSATALTEPIDVDRASIHLASELIGGLLSQRRALDAMTSQVADLTLEAVTDPLTGIGNRRAWDLAVQREQSRTDRYNEQLGVIVVDLDGFKQLNDSLGHGAGDERLRATAEALLTVCRDCDEVCRTGGDEFSILAVHSGVAELAALVARLRTTLSASAVPASLGAATHLAGESLTLTWERADAAMYRDKQRSSVPSWAETSLAG
jgi:diguanylate cyclase (GGDEF)-like protein